MEILQRAKGNSGELVPFNYREKVVKEEVDKRTARVGLTTRNGEPTYATKIMSRGIGPSKLNVWPRDENGNLIE